MHPEGDLGHVPVLPVQVKHDHENTARGAESSGAAYSFEPREMEEQAGELVHYSSDICPLIPFPSIGALSPVAQKVHPEGVNQHRVDEGGVQLADHHVVGAEDRGQGEMLHSIAKVG